MEILALIRKLSFICIELVPRRVMILLYILSLFTAAMRFMYVAVIDK